MFVKSWLLPANQEMAGSFIWRLPAEEHGIERRIF